MAKKPLTKRQVKDNLRRAERAQSTLEHYSVYELKGNGVSDDGQTTLTDLLTDLMHHAARDSDPGDKMNFEEALEMARTHFDAEKRGE